MGDPPSIVLILADQWRADACSPTLTPRVHRLAATGARFTTCVTNAPLCRPARITLITGQSVLAHGFPTNQAIADPERHPSVVRALAEAGYHTVMVGKSHLTPGHGHLDDHVSVLHRWGFHEVVELPDAQQLRVRSAYTDWLTATTPPGAIDKAVRRRDYLVNHTLGDPPDAEPWALRTTDHLDMFCARVAAERVLGLPRGPAFVQIGFPGPHPPFDATTEYGRRIDPDATGLAAPIARGPVGLPSRQRPRRRPLAELRALRHAYAAKVALVDAAIGTVLDALEASGRAPWIIVTADHGELLGDHGLTNKVVPYEGALRVPLIVRPPHDAPAREIVDLVDHIDVVELIRAIGGGGRSRLHALLDGARGDPERTVISAAMGWVTERSTVRKVVRWRRDGRLVGAFDLVRDPTEQRLLEEG